MIFITKPEDIKIDSPLQILYFYATSMPFYNKLVYLLPELEKKHKLSEFWAIDADCFKSQCIRFSVVSVPTLIFLQNGKEIKRVEGSVRKADFIAAFDDICI